MIATHKHNHTITQAHLNGPNSWMIATYRRVECFRALLFTLRVCQQQTETTSGYTVGTATADYYNVLTHSAEFRA